MSIDSKIENALTTMCQTITGGKLGTTRTISRTKREGVK
jgi:hypothetical protein